MEFGRVIKEFRSEQQLTQAHLSKALGISQGYLSLIENQHARPSLKLIGIISAEFRMTTGSFIIRVFDSSVTRKANRLTVDKQVRKQLDQIMSRLIK